MQFPLKPYPAYKPSGLQWLGDMPAHWEVRRIKTLFREKDERSGDGCAELLSLTRSRGLIPQKEASNRIASIEDLSNYKVCRPGDLVMNRMQAWSGMFAVPSQDGLISPDYSVFKLVCKSEVEYFERLFKTSLLVGQFIQKSRGIGSGFNRLYTADFGSIPAIVPPLSEQAAIVRYLDHADERIRRYVSGKQKLIRLLEEEKQAVIHRTVTRGLDPNVRLKPSGVEWLGDIPAHWGILPLKRWVSTKITDGPHETPALLAAGVPFMSAESMVGGRLDFSRRRGFISREQHEVYCRKCRPQRDDIFMCKSGATTGKVAIVETADEFSVWSPLALIRVDPQKVLARLLFAILQARYVQRQVQDTWSYGTQPNLSMGAMERLIVVLPPIDEQREVLAHLDRATKKPSEAVDRAHRQISLLREYRTRLIADVVTGQVDVRAAGGQVP